MDATKKFRACGIKGCAKPGIWNPVLLIGHDGPEKYSNPSRVSLKEDIGKKTERPLLVCEEHTEISIDAYMTALDWKSLDAIMRKVECPGMLPNTIGLQFERFVVDMGEIVKPSKWPFLKNRMVMDGGAIVDGQKSS